MLYLAALAATRHHPVIAACDARLCAAGKATKVALVACMHEVLLILDAVVKQQTPWATTGTPLTANTVAATTELMSREFTFALSLAKIGNDMPTELRNGGKGVRAKRRAETEMARAHRHQYFEPRDQVWRGADDANT